MLRFFNKVLRCDAITLPVLIIAAVLMGALLPAAAQVPGIPGPPYNTPVPPSSVYASPTTPTDVQIITNTLQGPATVDSQFMNTYGARGAICTVSQTAESGSPATNISIMAFDSASQILTSWGNSGIINNNNSGSTTWVPQTIIVYPGIAVSALPAGVVGVNLHLPRFFKVRQTTTGATTATTGAVGCELLN